MSDTRTGLVAAVRRLHARLVPSAGGVTAGGTPGAASLAAQVADELQASRTLAREARLLDERRWEDWLGLWAPGGRMAVPIRSTPQPTGPERSVAAELAAPGDLWWIDETKDLMEIRVAKLRTGKAWAEEPPSRTRRFVTNIEVASDGDDVLLVRSNLLLVRSRRDRDREMIVAARRDRWQRTDEGLRLAERHVTLDDATLVVDNMSLFL